MTPGPAAAYRVAGGEVERDAGVLATLWRGTLGDAGRMALKYTWFYRAAEAGPPLVALLRTADTDAVAGACTVGRRRMLLDGVPVRAGIFVDFAVDPAHRTLGPALILQRGLLAAAGGQFDLLYGFPNAKAAPVFSRTGYREVARMVRYVHVLRHAAYLRRTLPGWLARGLGVVADLASRARLALRAPGAHRADVEWRDAADDGVDALWLAAPRQDGLVGVRDGAFLRWRFDASPLAETRYLHVAAPDRSGRDAWFVVERAGATLHVRDFWSRHGGPRMAAWHVAALLCAARRLPDVVAVSVAMATRGQVLGPWRSLGFTARDSRPVFATSTDPACPLASPFECHLTSADEDE